MHACLCVQFRDEEEWTEFPAPLSVGDFMGGEEVAGSHWRGCQSSEAVTRCTHVMFYTTFHKGAVYVTWLFCYFRPVLLMSWSTFSICRHVCVSVGVSIRVCACVRAHFPPPNFYIDIQQTQAHLTLKKCKNKHTTARQNYIFLSDPIQQSSTFIRIPPSQGQYMSFYCLKWKALL